MRVGFYQNNPEFGNIKKNVDEVCQKFLQTEEALIVLPELFSSGYNFSDKSELKELSEEAGKGYTFDALSWLSTKNNLTIVFGFAEKIKDKFFNSQAIIENGKLLGVYRKIHLFNTENLFFTPGDEGFKVFNLKNGVKAGLMVCYDWIYPESVRTLALKGSHIICHSANLVMPYCPDAALTRAIENRVFYVLSNRVGTEVKKERTFSFVGKSEIISPRGEILTRASQEKTDISFKEINPFEADNKNMNDFNNIFEDRRKEFYL
ncbi:MAG: nitrilase-related carbon-nitrogen hydrolase [Candidatus Muiribacteriota bacterium]